jgi:hypothetical protein
VGGFPGAAVVHQCSSGLQPHIETILGEEPVVATHPFALCHNCTSGERGEGGGSRFYQITVMYA